MTSETPLHGQEDHQGCAAEQQQIKPQDVALSGLGPLRVSMDFERGKLLPIQVLGGFEPTWAMDQKKWPSCDNRWVELTKNSCPKLLERSDAYRESLAITWGDMFLFLTSPNSEELLTGQRQNLVVATTPSSERQVFSGVPSVSMMQKKSGPSAVKQEVSFPIPVADCRENHCAKHHCLVTRPFESKRGSTWICYRALRMFLQSLVSSNTGWLVLAKETNQMGNDIVCM